MIKTVALGIGNVLDGLSDYRMAVTFPFHIAEAINWAWRDGSAVKSTYYSSRRPMWGDSQLN